MSAQAASRLLSVALALAYWAIVWSRVGFGPSWIVVVVLLVPLGLIWFGDDLEASLLSLGGSGDGWDQTPGCMIRGIGWAFLLAPAVVWLVRR